VKEVLCNIAPMESFHLLLGWAWLHFKILNLDERSLCLRHEGHKMKFKFMTPRQVSNDQHRLKEKIEKEEIETAEGRENEEKENEVQKQVMENLFVNVFCNVPIKKKKPKIIKCCILKKFSVYRVCDVGHMAPYAHSYQEKRGHTRP